MTWSSRSLCALILLALLLLVASARPSWFRAIGLDIGGLPECLWTLQHEAERGDRLKTELDAALRRIAEKDRLAEDLVTGRLTPKEVAARFRQLMRDAPPFSRRAIDREEGKSEEERICRYLIRRFGNAPEAKPQDTPNPPGVGDAGLDGQRLRRGGATRP
jgi:hypothetical protein